MPTITHYTTHDLRFPTSLTGDGTDAMNTSCDYSAAYIVLYTSGSHNPPPAPSYCAASNPSSTDASFASGASAGTTKDSKNIDLTGYGMTFTIGRGNDLVIQGIQQVANRLIGKDVEALFEDMGKTWDWLMSDPQLRWIGPEKGLIHLATASVSNALWDLYARSRQKPLWKLIVDFSPEELVRSCAWRYISDALTKEEAIAMLKKNEAGKREREERVRKEGYPAYVTSSGWLGYPDSKITSLTVQALQKGFTHFKLKVGQSLEDDLRRGKLIRSLIDDPQYLSDAERAKIGQKNSSRDPEGPVLKGKNAGPTGCVLMIDANQVWDVEQAIAYVKGLSEIRPWFIEEPTAPDDVLGHARIRRELRDIPLYPNGPPAGVPNANQKITIGTATGEHAHNRILFKQLLQAEAIDVCQIDSCRLAGVSEVLSVLLMSAKFGIPVCPHAGGIGLCEYVIHLSLIDYISISTSFDKNVLEYVDHLHEHFVWPCRITEGEGNQGGHGGGRYVVPDEGGNEGYSIKMHESSMREYEWPNGTYWEGRRREGTL